MTSHYHQHRHLVPPPSSGRFSSSHNDDDIIITKQLRSSSTSSAAQQSPPIWSARGVEWPLPSAVNHGTYRKWRKESKSLGAALGIKNSGIRLLDNTNGSSSSSSNKNNNSATSNNSSSHNNHAGNQSQQQQHQQQLSSSSQNDTASTGYAGLSGIMGRVLGASNTTSSGVGTAGASLASLTNEIEQEDMNISVTRQVLPPKAKCVASANGWIVAVVECAHPPPSSSSSTSSSSSSMMMHSNTQQSQQSAYSTRGNSNSSNNTANNTNTPLVTKNGMPLTSLVPPLRLISRWNVRRNTSAMGTDGNQLVPLPPPVRPIDNTTDPPNFGQIVHTFIDPTGCHILLSAKNGEAYYLHSTSKKVRKLSGFGPNPDGTYTSSSSSSSSGGYNPGVAMKDAIGTSGPDAMSKVQTGLTPGSYVTAVGWDRDRGTEGSTKRIILGTSMGELYEYALVSPNAASSKSSSSGGGGGGSSSFSGGGGEEGGGSSKSMLSAFDARAGELGMENEEEPIDSPVLLRRLNPLMTGSSGSVSTTGGSGGGSVNNSATMADGGNTGAVGGILFQRMIGGVGGITNSDTGKEGGGYVVVLASFGGVHKHTRLFSFRSEPSSSNKELTLRSAFLRSAQGGGKGSFVELPGSVEFADLRSCNDGFAMRTETGIYYGTIERMASAVSIGGGVVDAGILSYESILGNGGRGGSCIPSSIGVTPHHFITLDSGNEVRFINRVYGKVIQKERVDWLSVSQSASGSDVHGGDAAELLMDIRRPDQIWLRKGRSLVHISSSCEGRDIWKYTLARCIDDNTLSSHPSSAVHGASGDDNVLQKSDEKHIENQFEYAKSLCNNQSQKATVNVARAEYHLSRGKTELAAKYLAQCPSSIMPFADTSARLALPMLGMEEGNSIKANESLANSNMALITFLTDKLRSAKRNNDTVVCTLIGSWLAELHLHERERDGSDKFDQSQRSQRNMAPVNHALLHQFLSTFVKDMDPKVIVNILSSHDISAGECAGYAAAAGDINAAVNAALFGEDEKAGALDALRVLNDSAIEKAEPYYYKHAVILLSRAPMAAAKSFLSRYSEGLSETRLLPAFMQYERKRAEMNNPLSEEKDDSVFVDDEDASVKYLEGVIAQGSRSRAVFNYLTSLYAAMTDEVPLFRFLSTHVPPSSSSNGGGVSELMLKQAQEEISSPLDKSQALRTILRTGRHFRSAVKLYMGFGMRQQAVELALKVDPSLARELARKSDDNDEKKRLWLMIARNAAAHGASQDGKDIVARVVAVLKDCGPDVLSIEDVLPFLPDFAQIDQFKDEICDALASYSSKIEHYIKEMNECDQTCDTLRDEISRLRSVGVQVRTNARCVFTNKCVMESEEPFYAFPSGYVVMEKALKREVLPYLNEKQRERVQFIEEELARLKRLRATTRTPIEKAKDDFEMNELQHELDGLIAAECPMTGSVMVDSITQGFLDDDLEYPL